MQLRDLPSVDELAREVDDPLAVDAARRVVEEARAAIRAGAEPGDLRQHLAEELRSAREARLRRAINATGVVVHTNLGRAPLARRGPRRGRRDRRGYSNLEYDLESGARGSRQDHVAGILRRLTGAEAALVVNNNAAAVLLALAALAEGREVLVSRGELIEIGDGFRIPDVLARSGAILREVGTTNRTRAADYDRAVRARDRAAPARPPVQLPRARLHRAAGREGARRRRAAALPPARGRPRFRCLLPVRGRALRPRQPHGRSRPRLFSGDKLLGGPQAGVIVGRADLVERLRRHPLQRALRADKLTLAALEGTLRLYLDPERAAREIPVLRMLGEDAAAVRARAERLAALVGGEVEETVGRAGGGALPLAELSSFACAVEEDLAGPLRLGNPPVIGVVRDGRLLLDCRTLTEAEVEEVAAAVTAARE